MKRPDLLTQWLANMNIRNWRPTKNSRICSDHFTHANFYTTIQTVRLLANAVPTETETASTYKKDLSIDFKDNTSLQHVLPVDVTQCKNIFEFVYSESQKAIPTSTVTASQSIICYYDTDTPTADDIIPQPIETQQIQESAPDTIYCTLSMTCYCDDENSSIGNKGHEPDVLPVHPTTPSPIYDDILIVPDLMPTPASDDRCTLMPCETKFCGDMPIADPTDVTIEDKVAIKLKKKEKKNNRQNITTKYNASQTLSVVR
jgi:THAP domain